MSWDKEISLLPWLWLWYMSAYILNLTKLCMLCVKYILGLGFLGGSDVKNLHTVQETSVQSLGLEGPLEEGMATNSNILVWRIPWAEEPGRLKSIGLSRVWYDWSNLACMYTYSHIYITLQNNYCYFPLHQPGLEKTHAKKRAKKQISICSTRAKE